MSHVKLFVLLLLVLPPAVFCGWLARRGWLARPIPERVRRLLAWLLEGPVTNDWTTILENWEEVVR